MFFFKTSKLFAEYSLEVRQQSDRSQRQDTLCTRLQACHVVIFNRACRNIHSQCFHWSRGGQCNLWCPCWRLVIYLKTMKLSRNGNFIQHLATVISPTCGWCPLQWCCMAFFTVCQVWCIHACRLLFANSLNMICAVHVPLGTITIRPWRKPSI